MAVKAADAWPRAMVLIDAGELYDPRIFVRGNPSQPGESRAAAVPPGPGRPRSPAVPAWQRAARPGPGDHRRRQSADQPGHRQPRLDAPLRRAAGLDPQRLRHPQHAAQPSRAARLPGRPAPGRGLVAQGAAPTDRALAHLPAGQLRPARLPQGRPGEPAALALSRGAGSTSRRCATRSCSSRAGWIARWAAGRWTWPATPRTGAGPSMAWWTARACPAMFRAFDFASPDQSAERRPRTTVPQQALFSMNAPFVIEQAKALAARPEVAGAPRPKHGSPRSTASSWPGPRPRPRSEAAARFVSEPDPQPGESGHSRLVPMGAARPGVAHDE